MSFDQNELLAPKGETFSYKKMEVGQDVKGVIVRTPKVVPHNDFVTKEQMKTRNGKPMWQIAVTIKTVEGDKTLWLEKRAYWGFINAVKELGLRTFEETEGLTFGIRRFEDIPSEVPGFAPAKDFRIKLVK